MLSTCGPLLIWSPTLNRGGPRLIESYVVKVPPFGLLWMLSPYHEVLHTQQTARVMLPIFPHSRYFVPGCEALWTP